MGRLLSTTILFSPVTIAATCSVPSVCKSPSADTSASAIRFSLSASFAPSITKEKVEKPSYYQATRQRGNYQTMCDFENPYNLLCDLVRSHALHGQTENLSHNLRRFFIDKPVVFILRIFHKPIGWVARNRLSLFH